MKLKKLLRNSLIFFLIYTIIIIMNLFVFSNKLSIDELTAVTNLYKEMCLVDNNIQSDFYVNNLIKVLDRDIILEELGNDTMEYSIVVSQESFSQYQSFENSVQRALFYLNNCDLNFENFVGTENSVEVFEITREYFQLNTQSVEGLSEYATKIQNLVLDSADKYDSILYNRFVKSGIYLVSYIIIVLLFTYIDLSKLKKLRS